jgi:hypothetical protein
MEYTQQPALLQSRGAPVGMRRLPENQGLRLRHLPKDTSDAVAVQALETAHTLVAVHEHVRLGAAYDDNRHLLAGVRERGQKTPLALRLPHPQRFVATVELMEFQIHAGLPRRDHAAMSRIWSCAAFPGSLPLPPTRSTA